jgi:hypothetical protein
LWANSWKRKAGRTPASTAPIIGVENLKPNHEKPKAMRVRRAMVKSTASLVLVENLRRGMYHAGS